MELFPVTIAVGSAFCNRVKEREQLSKYLEHGRHTVIIAPRRYGKTSLINEVLLEAKFPYTIMELTMATSLDDLERIIMKHIGSLLDKLLPESTKAKQKILKIFEWLNPEIVLSAGNQTITFRPDSSKLKTVETISDILKKLDEVAGMAGKRVVVVMDEFQQVIDIPDHTIEASIRSAMQYSKHVSYVFSGSNRHMLLSMFNDKNRPFYNSCETMKLERISADEYEAFIQKAAYKKWERPLPEHVLKLIFEVSELHSSYINRICGHFWLLDEFPTLLKVQKYWQNYLESKRSEFTEDILKLSKNQKRVLQYLAKTPTAHPSHREVCQAIEMSEASIRQVINKLTSDDYIYRDSEMVIRILDPAFRAYIYSL